MEMRQHELGDFLQSFLQGPLIPPEMKPDVLSTRFAHGVQFFNESIAAHANAKTVTLHQGIGMFSQIQVNASPGFANAASSSASGYSKVNRT